MVMKKMLIKNNLFSLCICLFGGMALVSCSSDDDEGAASTDVGVIAGKANVRVTQVGNYRFYYDDKGRIDKIKDGNYEEYHFKYNPNKVIWYDSDEGYSDDEVSISYNSNGFVSKVEASSSGKDGSDSWQGSGSASYSYDGQGHLTRISSSWKETGTEDGERYSDVWTVSTVLTWKNDMLVKIVEDEKDIEDGETETDNSIVTFTYATDNLDNYLNEYYQCDPSFAKELEGIGDGELEEALAYVGLMGKGSKYLPMSSKKEWEEYYDGKTHEGSSSYTHKYGFNSNGTISYATVNNTRYNYSYSDMDNDDRGSKSKIKIAQKESNGKRVSIVRRLFSHPRHYSTFESRK